MVSKSASMGHSAKPMGRERRIPGNKGSHGMRQCLEVV
ncbi:hypothetical protein DFR52_101324 [Hoeflea marina]|uniref:Uncharacterized protein n=1 Tax=Hoeflea marina TaxID=274592 RepID=A0A317PR39_9HYPH|nr:hypothetical protein DFR52_101324 [Hoeflea marina]